MISSTKMHQLRRVGLAAVLSLTTAAASDAQSKANEPLEQPGDTLFLTFAQAQRLARTSNPDLLATRHLSGVAEGRLRQAGVYRFNPEITLESEQVGSGRTLKTYRGELSQTVEWAGQRGLRTRAAEHGLEATEASVRDSERFTLAAASGVFYEALATQSRLELAEQILALNERLAVAVSDLLEAGSISVLEANLALIETGRAQTRVLEERRNASTALLDLRRTLGLTNDRALRLSPDVPTPPEPSGLDPDSLVRVAITRRPDLRAAASRIEAGQSLVSLSRRERLPNLRLSVPFDRLGGPGTGQIGIGVGISIPLWNRNQGTVAELRADVARTRSEMDAVEIAVRTEVVDAFQRYVSASEEEAISASSVLEPARFNQGLLDEAFSSGKIDLPTLLLIRNQLLDAELDYWESWLERRLELVRLETVTAAPLPNQ